MIASIQTYPSATSPFDFLHLSCLIIFSNVSSKIFSCLFSEKLFKSLAFRPKRSMKFTGAL